MPAYNVAPYIGEAIESVLSQEGVDVDLVVVDDGSTDRTAEVASRYADRGVRLIRNPTNRGISYSHNVVWRETSAPLIAHVDSDDRVLPGALAKLANARGCGHMEWTVLDWNEPAIALYESLGARRLREWQICRLTGQALAKYA